MIQGSCEYWEQYSKICGSNWRGVEKAMIQVSFQSAGRHDGEKAMIQDSCDQRVESSTARCVGWAALVVHVL